LPACRNSRCFEAGGWGSLAASRIEQTGSVGSAETPTTKVALRREATARQLLRLAMIRPTDLQNWKDLRKSFSHYESQAHCENVWTRLTGGW
jgi:hypothetical protein